MNNIQKNFKAKHGLCMAQGGMLTAQRFTPEERGEDVSGFMNPSPTGLGLADGTANVAQAAQPESAEQVMARMAAKYGVSAQPTAAPVQAPQPVQQAPQPVQQAPQPAPQRQGLMGAAMGLIGGRKAAIDRATGYAEGGIVRGAGGPTDDEVPMQVAGKDVNLSNSEAVLPVKTVQALGGPEAVEGLIERTNGKPPVRGGLRAGGAYGDGVTFGTGKRPTIYDNGGLPAPVVQAGIDTMRGQLADTRAPRRMSSGAIREVGADLGAAKEDPEALMQRVAKTHGLEYQTPAAVPTVRGQDTPTDPDTDGRTYSTPTAPAFVNRGAAAPAPTLKDAETTVDPRDIHAKILAQGTAVVNGQPKQGDAKYSMLKHKAEQEAKNPNIMGLRAAGVTGDVMGDVTENGKTGKTGIRTITTGSGNIYAGRDAKGQLNITAGLEKGSPADIDKARDAEFAAKGYGKDANGHWMTPERLGVKASLRDLEYSNAKFNATSDQITDPNARAAGLRGLAQYDIEEKASTDKAVLAAKVAEIKAKNAPSAMDIAKFMQHERDVAQMQQNTVNAAAASAKKDARKDVREILGDMYEGDVEGKKAAQRYAANYDPIDQNKETPEQYQQGILEDLDMEAQLDAEGRHWLTPERGFSGTASMWKQRPAGLTDAFRGYLGGNVYEDPATGRVIKLPNGMSDAQRKKFLEKRLTK